MKRLRSWWQKSSPGEATEARQEAMTPAKVGFNFRVYWTKMLLQRAWTAEERAAVRAQVLDITSKPSFESNLIVKQYALPLAGIPESSHSGASLLALLEVLDALDHIEET